MIAPISNDVWQRLAAANRRGVEDGWAEPGVFGTGIGPEYRLDGSGVLYVGKSAGPLGNRVGSNFDQVESVAASTRWMVDRANKSAFWQMIDLIDPTRRSIAWTNIVKMDRKGGNVPPRPREWMAIRDACFAALGDEIRALRPRLVMFATSDYLHGEVTTFLHRLGYQHTQSGLDDGWTTTYERSPGEHAIMTKHPQGWDRVSRDNVVGLALRKLGRAP